MTLGKRGALTRYNRDDIEDVMLSKVVTYERPHVMTPSVWMSRTGKSRAVKRRIAVLPASRGRNGE